MTYRAKLAKQMDTIIRNFNDEDNIEPWLLCGCPDESSNEDYEWYAENPAEFEDLVALFLRLVKRELSE